MIFQITIGCSWNKCRFCEMYSTKKFRVRDINEIENEIKFAAINMPSVYRKFFLADGDALVMETKKLLRVLNCINTSFDKVQRISAYASPSDILGKSEEDLQKLKENGLKLLYIGIESGDNEVLEKVNKGETFDSISSALMKAHKAGMDTSVMIITGLGGKKYSQQHAINSAKLVNTANPKYVSLLTLWLTDNEKRFHAGFEGKYQKLNNIEILEEIKTFISHTKLDKSIFRTDHVSNLINLKGILSRDNEKCINEIDQVIEWLLKN